MSAAMTKKAAVNEDSGLTNFNGMDN